MCPVVAICILMDRAQYGGPYVFVEFVGKIKAYIRPPQKWQRNENRAWLENGTERDAQKLEYIK